MTEIENNGSASERAKEMVNKLQKHKSTHPRLTFEEINVILRYLYWVYRPDAGEPDTDLEN